MGVRAPVDHSVTSSSGAKSGSYLTPLPQCLCPGPRVARRGMGKTVGLPFFEILFNIRQNSYSCIGCFLSPVSFSQLLSGVNLMIGWLPIQRKRERIVHSL